MGLADLADDLMQVRLILMSFLLCFFGLAFVPVVVGVSLPLRAGTGGALITINVQH